MNEHDWLTGTDFAAHVRFVADRLSLRRQRLLAVAFCRAAGDLLDHPELTAALDAIDRSADASPRASVTLELARQDCRAVAQQVYDAYRTATDAGRDAGTAKARSELAWAVSFAANNPLLLELVGTRALEAVAEMRVGAAGLLRAMSPAFQAALEAHKVVLLERVGEIAGNPFRRTHFAPEWRTDTVRAIATQMYDSREFSAMPILADALQDAGCDHEDLLRHCRDASATHVRGCWALDLVLDLE